MPPRETFAAFAAYGGGALPAGAAPTPAESSSSAARSARPAPADATAAAGSVGGHVGEVAVEGDATDSLRGGGPAVAAAVMSALPASEAPVAQENAAAVAKAAAAPDSRALEGQGRRGEEEEAAGAGPGLACSASCSSAVVAAVAE